MNLTNPEDLKKLLDAGYRVLLYRSDFDPDCPEPGPYRARIFEYPLDVSKNIHAGCIASGETVETMIVDFDSVGDIEEFHKFFEGESE